MTHPMTKRALLQGALVAASAGCVNFAWDDDDLSVKSEPFGTIRAGEKVDVFTLQNRLGTKVRLMTLGASLVSVDVADRAGVMSDIVLGFDTPRDYLSNPSYFGAVIGRFANRIEKGRFHLDGYEYRLPVNNGPNHLHGGDIGFDRRIWSAAPFKTDDAVGVTFYLRSADGDQGYPGNLDVWVTHTLDQKDQMTVAYRAQSDRATIVNFTQHAYFNLAGHEAGDILDHELRLNADTFTPIRETSIPTGEIAPVEGTPMDFRSAKRIGRDIELETQQLVLGSGYDHNWVLNQTELKDGLALAAEVYDPRSGRTLRVHTDQPGVQLYTGNFLKPGVYGKGGTEYGRRHGFCLETQHFPDSPNQPHFPSTRLGPGEFFNSRTVFVFGLRP